MWLIDVLPITRSALHRELTYFAKERIPEGSVVRIGLRGKKAYGLVLRAREATSEKQAVRKGSYSLQKLSMKGAGAPFSRAFLRTAFEAAAYHAASAGAVIGEVAPAAILAAGAKLPQHTPKKE